MRSPFFCYVAASDDEDAARPGQSQRRNQYSAEVRFLVIALLSSFKRGTWVVLLRDY